MGSQPRFICPPRLGSGRNQTIFEAALPENIKPETQVIDRTKLAGRKHSALKIENRVKRNLDAPLSVDQALKYLDGVKNEVKK